MSCAITPEQDPELTEVCGKPNCPKLVKDICQMHYSRYVRFQTYGKKPRKPKVESLGDVPVWILSKLVLDKYPLETLVL